MDIDGYVIIDERKHIYTHTLPNYMKVNIVFLTKKHAQEYIDENQLKNVNITDCELCSNEH